MSYLEAFHREQSMKGPKLNRRPEPGKIKKVVKCPSQITQLQQLFEIFSFATAETGPPFLLRCDTILLLRDPLLDTLPMIVKDFPHDFTVGVVFLIAVVLQLLDIQPLYIVPLFASVKLDGPPPIVTGKVLLCGFNSMQTVQAEDSGELQSWQRAIIQERSQIVPGSIDCLLEKGSIDNPMDEVKLVTAVACSKRVDSSETGDILRAGFTVVV